MASAASSSSFSASILPIAVVTLVVYGFYRFLVYPVYLSPLSNIPNAHWSSPISPLWILYVRYKRNENATLLEAHKKSGPVVRLGPSDISVDHIDHVKTVYGGGFDRTEWYSMFDNYGVPCMFSTVPGREHALRKRMISNVYSKSFIQSSPALASQARSILLDRLLPVITASAAGDQEPHGIEVVSLFLATSMDFIAAYIFGLRCGTDFINQAAYREHWLQLYLNRHGASFFLQEIPGLTRFLLKFGISPYPRWVNLATDELGEWNKALYEKTMTFLAAMKERKGAKTATLFAEHPEDEPVVLQSMLTALERETVTNGSASILYDTAIKKPELSVQSELFDHILAGQETTGIGLSFLIWQLSLNQDAQDALRHEILQLQSKEQDGNNTPFFPEAKKLDSLPILHAVIMETLRLFAPIEVPLPRQTPPRGCHVGPYEIPGGVRIASQAHTLHRNARIFSDPEGWDYTRWLDPSNGNKSGGADAKDDDAKRAQARQFWAFSSGGRMCIGSNFAMNEMKEVTAMIYSRFKTHVVDDSGMVPPDNSITSSPAFEKLYLRFEPL